MLQGKIEFLLLPIVLGVVMLSVWGIAPLLWLIRVVQKKPGEQDFFARLAPWLIAIASAIAAVFLFSVFVLLIFDALTNENTIPLVLGAPRAWLPIYLLPLCFAMFALVYTIAIVRAWLRSSWDIGRRAYYSLLAAAAVGMTLWFAWQGILFAFVN